ncbi:MAG TPA: phosphoglycerate kinase [Candidatus Paceibacterota bacterium]|nr:phosphoglycerate kinase [Candidatus Paceibacterota bacterium]
MKPLVLPGVERLSKKQLSGKRVIVRLDLNVPIEDGQVTETYRIDRSVPTLEFLRKQGAKVLAISHLGDGSESLKPAADYLRRKCGAGFVERLADLNVSCLPDGEIVVLENLRQHKGEEKNSPTFAKELASHGDLYVNDAFSASHRKHASIVGLPKLLPAFAGMLLQEEVRELSRAFEPKHPFVVIIGGAKFSTKLPLLKRFFKSADRIFVVGALAHGFFKKKGWSLGKSLVDTKVAGIEPFLKSAKLALPFDVVIENTNGYYVKTPDSLAKDDVIFDAGPDFIQQMREEIAEAKFVLWNGPLGNFEKGYDRGTLEAAKAIAKSKAHSVIGGGDTIAAISRLDILKEFDFVSTGGGAMLDFLSAGTLPGIDALVKQPKRR